MSRFKNGMWSQGKIVDRTCSRVSSTSSGVEAGPLERCGARSRTPLLHDNQHIISHTPCLLRLDTAFSCPSRLSLSKTPATQRPPCDTRPSPVASEALSASHGDRKRAPIVVHTGLPPDPRYQSHNPPTTRAQDPYSIRTRWRPYMPPTLYIRQGSMRPTWPSRVRGRLTTRRRVPCNLPTCNRSNYPLRRRRNRSRA